MAIVSLVTFYVFPSKNIHAAAFDILAKTYSNSVMAMFNNRIRITGGRESYEEGTKLHISLHPQTETGPESMSSSQSQIMKHEPNADGVRAEVYVDTDSVNLNEQVTFILPSYHPYTQRI